jgi:hypothetical protein
MQKPSIGRIVHYCHNGSRYAAIITYVCSDTCVNLVVFDHRGMRIDGTIACNYFDEFPILGPNQTSIPHGCWTWPPRS